MRQINQKLQWPEVLHLNIFIFAKVTLSYGIEKEFEGLEIKGRLP
jgi:hypothetical protein